MLRAVARMGYVGVEFAGYYGYSAQQLRSLLDEVGLVCCGTHIGLDTLQEDEMGRGPWRASTRRWETAS